MYNLTNITNSTTTKAPIFNGERYDSAGAVEIVFLVFLMICIITGNSLVCFSFSIVDRKLRTVTNYFVINLALSDILVGTFSLPFWLCIRNGK
eukprot:gene5490-6175_t